MIDFKKALVICAAISAFASGAYTFLNGADSLLATRVLSVVNSATRNAQSMTNAPSTPTSEVGN